MTRESPAWLGAAKVAMAVEADAISRAATRLGDDLCRAVEMICAHSGKVVVSGVGKSGHVGQKFAGTLCSTGVPAVFLHPGDAVHGDLGILSPGDPVVLISKSGTTAELIRLIPALRRAQSPFDRHHRQSEFYPGERS